MLHIKSKDGTKLYYKDWGQGRPVILLHGWPLTSDSFDDAAMVIADAGMRAISYDRRGFGRSGQPWSGYDYDTLTDDLAAVMEDRQVRDATLVGFSMGGGEVARYMSRYQGKNVAQAVLISSIAPYMLQQPDNPNGVPQKALDEMATAMKEDRAKFFSGFFKDFFGESMVSKPVSAEVLQWAQNQAMQASLKATLECAKSFGTTDFRADMAAFKVPTLVIHGSADKTVPIDATGRRAARMIPSAKLIEYDGAPHGVFATHKAQLNEDLLRFLKER
jgi:non-heme chloroperoxidase